MTQTEALRLALEYVELVLDDRYSAEHIDQDALITAIKAALEAKDEPVPVAIVEVFGKDWRLDYMALPVGKHKLYAQQYTYTTPPQRKPLTDEQAMDAYFETPPFGTYKEAFIAGIRFIEAAHGITGENT